MSETQTMHDMTEATLLRAIAENVDDQAGRLVLADWLEEHGESDRAEFLRVQCELTSTDLPAQRRQALRVRERSLLDAHRQAWVQAFDLPVQDVCFERGLIARMSLSQWDQGKLLDAAHAPWLVTLAELDLSGLGLGDAGLVALAAAQFPVLRKLMLNGNKITHAGASALAQATGLPRLDTVYLFDNPLSDGSRTVLEQAARFRLTHLDLGERAEGYCMSPGQTEMARRRYLHQHLLPEVTRHFQTYPRLQSAMLCVAQYWADEANDAVHGKLIVSELFEPKLEGARSGYEEDSVPDVNVPNTRIESQYGGWGSAIDLWGVHWHDNSGAIPLWAAYTTEEGSQEYESLAESYAPAVMFYRHGGYEFLPIRRPHLDGIQPEWGDPE